MIWRYLLAFLLSLAVIVGFQYFGKARPKDPVEQPDKPETVGQAAGPEVGAAPSRDASVEAPNPESDPESDEVAKPAAEGDSAADARESTEETTETGPPSPVEPEPLVADEGTTDDSASVDDEVAPPAAASTGWRVDWSDDGGRVLRVSSADGKPLLDSGSTGSLLSVRLAPEGSELAPIEGTWQALSSTARTATHQLVVGEGPLAGLSVRRTVSLPDPAAARPAARHNLRAIYQFSNQGQGELKFASEIGGPAGLVVEEGEELLVASSQRGRRNVVTPQGEQLQWRHVGVQTRPAAAVVGAPWVREGDGLWVGIASDSLFAAMYSFSALQAAAGGDVTATVVEAADAAGGKLTPSTALRYATRSLSPGQTLVRDVRVYAGPRDTDLLSEYWRLGFDRIQRRTVELGGAYRLEVDTSTGTITQVWFLEHFEDPGDDPDRPRYQFALEPADGVGLLTLDRIVLNLGGAQQSATGGWRTAWRLELDETEGAPDGSMAVDRLNLVKEHDGFRVRKSIELASLEQFQTLQLPAGTELGEGRLLKVRLEIENLADDNDGVFLHKLHGPTAIRSESLRGKGSDLALAYAWRGEKGTIGTEQQTAGDLPEQGAWESPPAQRGNILWTAVSSSYFTSLLFPWVTENGNPTRVDQVLAERLPEEGDGEDGYETMRASFLTELQVAPQTRSVLEYGLYMGPRECELIKSGESLAFSEVNDYGMFTVLVNLFMGLIRILRGIAFGNWGLAIILLTVLVKLCLHPINRKSQRAMMRFQKKFQKIQPQMKALQEEMGNDRVRYSQEVQKLWKQHGVNPGQQMLGCLVLLLQLPIWIGLFRTLDYEIGLRHASFLYIDDLTKPDRLFPLGFNIPFLGSWFNLLPVLYVILTIVNQRLQPRPTDPQMQAQHKMMQFMMVFFGFIFYSFPAGFMLYIMTSSALGIIESKLIKAQLAKEEAGWEAEATATATATATVAATPAYPTRSGSGAAAAAYPGPKKNKGKNKRKKR